MKADNTTTGHSRIIKVTEIPGDTPELTLGIGYREQSSALNGICLDYEIIPRIMLALNDAGAAALHHGCTIAQAAVVTVLESKVTDLSPALRAQLESVELHLDAALWECQATPQAPPKVVAQKAELLAMLQELIALPSISSLAADRNSDVVIRAAKLVSRLTKE